MIDINKTIKRFNKRWDVTNNLSYGEEFEKFKIRVLNIFSDIDEHITKESIVQFCQILGIAKPWEYQPWEYQFGADAPLIIGALTQEKDEKQFYYLLQIIFSLPIQILYGPNMPGISMIGEEVYSKKILFTELVKVINLSNVNLAITSKSGEIILYPRGEKLLDQKLVDDVLGFLDKNSQKHFIDALKLYEKKNSQNAVKSSESLRRSLEEFLHYKLQNQKGLKANIKELQVQLRTDKRDPRIRNIIFLIFNYLDQYFNENSKHNDGTIDEADNEYLIYHIGALMRYIHKSLK